MTPHLSHEELVDALDGRLLLPRARHVEECEICRADVDGLRGLVAGVADAEGVPEPSAGFWTGMKARVRAEVEPGRQARGWMSGWAWQAIAASLVVGVTALTLMTGRRAPDLRTPAPEAAWSDVEQVAGALSSDEAQGLTLSMNAPSSLIDDLTPAERAAFAALVVQEMGTSQ